jgi:hypothetical protein
VTTALFCVAVGCGQAPAATAEAEKPELTPEQKALVLDSAPTDIPKPLYMDFNGKAELLGYSLEPSTMAAPGSKLSLKLYWRSTSKLGPGYKPFTQIVTGNKRFDVEGGGPVRRGALGPETWEPGKVYVDELDVTVPDELDSSRFSIVVGLRTAPIAVEEPEAAAEKQDEKAEKTAKPAAGQFGAVYLSVLSGPADAKYGGVLATLETGLTPGAQRVRAAKDGKPQKRPPSTRPASAKPRPSP